MRIADLNRRVTIQKLQTLSDFFGEGLSVAEEFSVWANIKDKGISESDSNGHVHETRELIVTLRSSKKTRAIEPDTYQLLVGNRLYDITHVEDDSRISRWVTLHARRNSHSSE